MEMLEISFARGGAGRSSVLCQPLHPTDGALLSRLRPHNQNITVAARAMAEGKTLGQRSYRVATRGQSFRRPNMISITARQ
ncbi:hypothetical protein AKJ29_04375 [Aliiroseovarius crassostreae]|uniref:Uncharacterized protein n=1 Tax=Aliiroseovarius crassostreae TaxID=154981 RepID=A0A0P7ISS4_9RHOB|nr:hypothetical protein AKJ29_04375 [Aliiroseovarius crassostreae]